MSYDILNEIPNCHEKQTLEETICNAHIVYVIVVVCGKFQSPVRLESLAHLQIPKTRVRQWGDALRVRASYGYIDISSKVPYIWDDVFGEDGHVVGGDSRDKHCLSKQGENERSIKTAIKQDH